MCPAAQMRNTYIITPIGQTIRKLYLPQAFQKYDDYSEQFINGIILSDS